MKELANPMNESYDVILMGIDADVIDRQASINNIAQLLEIDASKLTQFVDNNFKTIVRHGISLEDARRCQRQILRLGGFCNYRPTENGELNLQLAPKEEDKGLFVFVCPACSYRQELTLQEESPVNCPKCGIVPSKFIKIAAIKYQRELIKKRLLGKHQLLAQRARAMEELKEEEAERRKLEDEVRKELGLPRIINSRLQLFGSAAMLWALGIAMGLIGVGLYSKQTTVAWNVSATAGEGANYAESKSTPQLETLRQINGLSKVSALAEMEPSTLLVPIPRLGHYGENPLANSTSAKVQTGANSAFWTSGQWKPVHMAGKALMQEMRMDREWELYLAAEAERLAKLKQPAQAYRRIEAINSVRFKLNTLGILAGHYFATKDKLEVDNVLGMAAASIKTLPDRVERVDSWAWLATTVWHLGEKVKAQKYLGTAENLLSTLSDSAEKARGLASLATRQAQIGQMKQAEMNFQLANQNILSVSNLNTKLRSYLYLAHCYAQIGNKAVPAVMLISILNTVNRFKDKIDQQGLIGEVALAFVDIGEADYAFAALEKLTPQQNEKMLFNVTRELTYNDLPFDAMKGLGKLAAPEYQSRAAALLSLVFSLRPDMHPLSSSFLQNAAATQDQIANPQDQAVVRGEMSRYQAHAGFLKEAGDWANKAMQSAQSIKNVQERDIAFALLAIDFARSKQTTQASASVAQIKEVELAEIVAKEVFGINLIFSE